MKKRRKSIWITLLVVTFIVITGLLAISDFGLRILFSEKPRSPRSDLPVTYNIGWWPYQDKLKIDSVRIKVIESKLNLFNDKSLVSYEVFGQVYASKGWEPDIKEIHLSERFESDSLKKFQQRIIEITPIVSVEENHEYKETLKNFKFTNEHIINSTDWGVNKIKFVCGTQIKNIELRQNK